jgi:hypothetical protein
LSLSSSCFIVRCSRAIEWSTTARTGLVWDLMFYVITPIKKPRQRNLSFNLIPGFNRFTNLLLTQFGWNGKSIYSSSADNQPVFKQGKRNFLPTNWPSASKSKEPVPPILLALSILPGDKKRKAPLKCLDTQLHYVWTICFDSVASHKRSRITSFFHFLN